MSKNIVDDKSQHCIPFITERLLIHRQKHALKIPPPPFFLGINGIQGVGKTTLVSTLESTLNSTPYNIRTVVFSIDDLYLPHTEQVALAAAHPNNRLIQHRGQPGTHDVRLGVSVFRSLSGQRPVRIPRYDKSAFDGRGDRLGVSLWREVNRPVDVVIFEGWCVGFRALDVAVLEIRWRRALEERNESSRLWRHTLDELRFVNDALREYDALTNHLDALIHLDVLNLQSVYPWRMEQEFAQRAIKGSGMTDEQIIAFVDGYYPAYELYVEDLRRGVFRQDEPEKKGAQLRLVIGEQREVRLVETI